MQFITCILLLSVSSTAIEIDNGTMEIAPVDPAILPSCSTILCRQGYKSVMAEPANCFGCITRPQCVQQQCDTTCFCSRFQKCVLVATDCCPVPSCRSMITLKPPTIRTIRFTLEPPMETIVPGPGDPVEQPM